MMSVLVGILGAIVGIAVAAFFTEVVFPNDQDWPIIFLAVGAVTGWLLFRACMRRFVSRRA